MKDPKTSRWLWDIRERSRQKKRTENYRSIIAMQQSASFSGGADGEGGTNPQVMEDMTRLTDKQQMANFLTWGKWDLDNSAIEKLVKDEERKERVSGAWPGHYITDILANAQVAKFSGYVANLSNSMLL